MSEYYVPRDVLGFSEDLYSLFLSEQPVKSYEAGQDCLYWFNFKFVSREATIPVKNDDPIKIIGWFPVDWSEMAAKIVAGKYFRTYPNGKQENSVITMVMRVVGTITQWVSDNEQISIKEAFDSVGRPLINMILSQRATFNSPVWFNLGYQNRKQQASACYILEIEDNMESILDWYKEAGMIFKGGSGAGINISPLREKGAPLSTGGETSGPLSFMATADQNAAAIKSAGASRRAASIIVMDDWHPDIEEFINCKLVEEQKAHALIEAGYSPNFDDENGAYHSVKYQNANHTVRLSDQFMNAVDADQDWQFSNGKVKKARDIANQIANAAHACGDPGVQFIDTIEHWNTCSDTECITSTNPCVTGDTLVSTERGMKRIRDLVNSQEVVTYDDISAITKSIFSTGNKETFLLETKSGYQLRLTEDHPIVIVDRFGNERDIPLRDVNVGDNVKLGSPTFGTQSIDNELSLLIGMVAGDGCIDKNRNVILTISENNEPLLEIIKNYYNTKKRSENETDGRRLRETNISNRNKVRAFTMSNAIISNKVSEYVIADAGSANKDFTDKIFELDRESVKAILQGLFVTDGTVAHYGEKSHYISLDSTSTKLLNKTQLLLLSFGIKSKIYSNRNVSETKTLPDGNGGKKDYQVQQISSLRISKRSRVLFEKHVGFPNTSHKHGKLSELNSTVTTYSESLTDSVKSITPTNIVEPVFDMTVPGTNHFLANGILVHNCSEFSFLNNTSCNLASLNVVKYELDSQKIESDVRTLVRAMDAIVSFAYYPTEKITEKTKRFRPLGIGISNLGSYFMRELIPYDSYEARSIASSIMAFITAVGYDESSKLARKIGPFSEYKYNKGSMNRVIRQHHEAAAELDESLGIAAYEIFSKLVENSKDENFGYRNAQMSLVAPAGTISFMMDCETTGLEPALSLTYYKQFVGGGVEKNISKTAKTAIINYGKTRNNNELSEEIIKRIENDQAFEDIASNKLLDILDCALPYPAHDSKRCISADAHVKMLAAIQPFISGASSKTVNMPATATPEDVWNVYRDAWKAGIKCVALYVDGSKGSQPIYTSKSKKDDPEKPETVVVRNGRVRLPDERHSLTHKFNIGQHEGYVTVGFYPDGKPGEIFITMSKEGSTISGLMDTIATITSISLQHGIPIESLCKKFRDVRFEPSGITGNPDIRFAHSIVDYIFRWLELKVANNGIEDYHVENHEKLPDQESTQTGDICPECGMSTMVRTGSCMTCTTCGTNTGCG